MDSSIAQTNVIKLNELPVGSSARVVSVTGTGRVTQRLMEMGIIPGIGVKVVKEHLVLSLINFGNTGYWH